MEAWRAYNLSRAYKRPFEDMKTVHSGLGTPMKIGTEDRKALMLHANLVPKDKLHLLEHRNPLATRVRRLVGIKEKHPVKEAKVLIQEWNREKDYRTVLNG